MAAGYFASGKAARQAVFEFFVRRLPANRDVLIAAGLQQAVEYLLDLRFTDEQIDYLQNPPAICTREARVLGVPAGVPLHRRRLCDAEGTPFLRGRACRDGERAHHRSATRRDVSAGDVRVPVDDRVQSRT